MGGGRSRGHGQQLQILKAHGDRMMGEVLSWDSSKGVGVVGCPEINARSCPTWNREWEVVQVVFCRAVW